MATKKGYTTQDAALAVSKALPAAAGTVYSDPIDLGPISGNLGVRSEKFELAVAAPALTAAQLPASASIAYKIQASDDKTFSEGVVAWDILEAGQTGGAAGAAAGEFRFRPPLDSPRYWRLAATVTGSVGSGLADASAGLKYVC